MFIQLLSKALSIITLSFILTSPLSFWARIIFSVFLICNTLLFDRFVYLSCDEYGLFFSAVCAVIYCVMIIFAILEGAFLVATGCGIALAMLLVWTRKLL